MTGLLEVRDLSVRFGGVSAVSELDFSVEGGSITGLIGPNGAGKTTTIDALSGIVSSTGEIVFDGQELGSWAPHLRARAGLVRTWQSLELFDDLTVLENLLVAAEPPRWWDALLDVVAPTRHGRPTGVDWAIDLLDVADLLEAMPTELSLGQRKLVGVARALASRPRLILLDEPAAGLDTTESERFGRRLQDVRDAGVTVLLVDHDMGLVLSVCDTVYVIEFGERIAAGTPAEIRNDDAVIHAYLGQSAGDDTPPALRLPESTTPQSTREDG